MGMPRMRPMRSPGLIGILRLASRVTDSTTVTTSGYTVHVIRDSAKRTRQASASGRPRRVRRATNFSTDSRLTLLFSTNFGWRAPCHMPMRKGSTGGLTHVDSGEFGDVGPGDTDCWRGVGRSVLAASPGHCRDDAARRRRSATATHDRKDKRFGPRGEQVNAAPEIYAGESWHCALRQLRGAGGVRHIPFLATAPAAG